MGNAGSAGFRRQLLGDKSSESLLSHDEGSGHVFSQFSSHVPNRECRGDGGRGFACLGCLGFVWIILKALGWGMEVTGEGKPIVARRNVVEKMGRQRK